MAGVVSMRLTLLRPFWASTTPYDIGTGQEEVLRDIIAEVERSGSVLEPRKIFVCQEELLRF